jgi:hypothetical protein
MLPVCEFGYWALWNDAIKAHKSHGLPRASVLKVPHHGASNALALEHNRKNYLDLCRKDPRPYAVLFAGDAKHPNKTVFEELRKKTRLHCLANGLKGAEGPPNQLNVQIPGARQVQASRFCQPQLTVEITNKGYLRIARTTNCDICEGA